MTANIKRMQQALGLEKLTSDEVRDYLRKMSSLVLVRGKCMSRPKFGLCLEPDHGACREEEVPFETRLFFMSK